MKNDQPAVVATLRRLTNSLGRWMVLACALLAIAIAVMAVRSFWHCDEAGYYSWKALAGTDGLDCRQIIGSYRGGFFYVSTQAEVSGNVDWYGGPPMEIITDHEKAPALAQESVTAMAGPFDPAGHWRRGGFGFAAESATSRDGKAPLWQRGFTLPDWLLFLLLAWWPALRLRRRWRIHRRRGKGFCLHCGYDLRASSAVCPECGKSAAGQRPIAWPKHGFTRRWAAALALAACVAVGLPWGLHAWGRAKKETALRLEPGMPLPVDHLPSRIDLEIAPGVSVRFALIPAGHFLMGSPPDEQGRNQDELQHEVIISKPFYMALTLVTQEQYRAVIGSNPSYYKGPMRPVDTVSCDDAVEFCRRVAEKTGRKVHLPTEAQWEYACRAGTTTPFNIGSTIPRDSAAYGTQISYPSCRHNARDGGAIPVGSFRANAWGLYDMHGNIWQWCSDWYDGDYYAKSPKFNPTGPAQSSRILPFVFCVAAPGAAIRASAVPPSAVSTRPAFAARAVLGFVLPWILSNCIRDAIHLFDRDNWNH